MFRISLISSRCLLPKSPTTFSLPKNNILRFYSRNDKGGLGSKYDTYIREKAKSTGAGAFNIGKGALAGAAAVGVGALCFYGSGMGSQMNTLNNSMLWPKHVRERIHATYAYLGGSLLITAVSAMACAGSPVIMRYLIEGGMLTFLGSFALMVGTGMVARSIEYTPGFGSKQLAWALHCGVIGLIIAPICFLGGPVVTRAVWYTAGCVGGISTVAVCAPSDQFLYMGGILGAGLGVVFASALASMFIPPTGAIGAGLASISIYGGLILFSGFVLYDTQRIVRMAETYPIFVVYDPIEASMSLYMDTINIFIRIVTILASGNNRKR